MTLTPLIPDPIDSSAKGRLRGRRVLASLSEKDV